MAAILGGSVLWGLAWWPIRVLDSHGVRGAMLTLVVYGAPAVLLLPQAWRLRRQWLAQWRMLLGILILGGLWNLSYMIAMIHGHAGRVVLLCYLSTAWAVLGGRVFLGESVNLQRWLCVVLALAGAWMIVGESSVSGGYIALVDLLAIGCGIAHAGTNLMFRHIAQVPVVTKNAAMFSGAVCAACIAVWGSGSSAGAAEPSAWMAAAVFGMLWVLSAESLTQLGVSQLPAARSSILLTVELPITVISAALIAKEDLRGLEWLGGILIVLATVIEVWRGAPVPIHVSEEEVRKAA